MQRSSVVLPAPFGPAEREALARLDAEREVAQDDVVAEAAGEAVDLDHGGSVAEIGRTVRAAGECRPLGDAAEGLCGSRRGKNPGRTRTVPGGTNDPICASGTQEVVVDPEPVGPADGDEDARDVDDRGGERPNGCAPADARGTRLVRTDLSTGASFSPEACRSASCSPC